MLYSRSLHAVPRRLGTTGLWDACIAFPIIEVGAIDQPCDHTFREKPRQYLRASFQRINLISRCEKTQDVICVLSFFQYSSLNATIQFLLDYVAILY